MSQCCCATVYDWDEPAVCDVKTRRARREYHCCECHDPIRPGERYEYVHGLWDGRWDTFRPCATCVRIRSDLCGRGFLYGALSESVFDCLGMHLTEVPVD